MRKGPGDGECAIVNFQPLVHEGSHVTHKGFIVILGRGLWLSAGA